MDNIVSIKGTKDGLLILLNPEYHFETVKQELQDKLTASKGFFVGAKFELHSPKKYTMEEQKQLTKICCDNGLIPIEKPKEKQEKFIGKSNFNKGLKPEELKEKCLLLNKNIRSGQSIKYDGHIVILGNVHQGAEIIASGNILVMGNLNGLAHAGAKGNTKAVITAFSLRPTQLRIADFIKYKTSNLDKTSKPAIAYLVDNQIVIEEYDSHRLLPMIS